MHCPIPPYNLLFEMVPILSSLNLRLTYSTIIIAQSHHHIDEVYCIKRAVMCINYCWGNSFGGTDHINFGLGLVKQFACRKWGFCSWNLFYDKVLYSQIHWEEHKLTPNWQENPSSLHSSNLSLNNLGFVGEEWSSFLDTSWRMNQSIPYRSTIT